MKQRFPFDYRTIQRIKFEEYEQFFQELPGYELYANHLGEVRWMKEAEALQQHEFYLYEETPFLRLKKRLSRRRARTDVKRMPRAERELRLQIRRYLEQRYLGKLRSETEQQLPSEWLYEISPEEIENIPITVNIVESVGWDKKVLGVAALIALLLVVAAGLLFKFGGEKHGQLLVKTNVEAARVYLNETDFLGYSGRIIENVPTGIHRISVMKAGYVTIPSVQEVEVMPDSLTVVHFQLKPRRSEVIGYLKIVADQPESKIFIDGEYFGLLKSQPLLRLEEGQHRVVVERDGYVTIPSEKMVTISAGDTTFLILEQVALSRKGRTPSAPVGEYTFGTIEVTSNIPGARIYLDGKFTERETDYIFTDVPLGRHTIRVEKEGYKAEPPQREIVLSRDNPTGEVHFTLKKEYQHITIRTSPEGDIFVDGELKGRGVFEGLLKLGEHRIEFGDLPGYKRPNPRKINLLENRPAIVEVEYFPEMHIRAEVTENGNVHLKDCELFYGYTLGNRGFSSSEEAGPEIVFHEKLNTYLWKFGFAFPFRNPKGNDAVKLTFQLPQNLRYEQKFTLRILAASSKERYPLAITTKTDIYIKLNGAILSYYYQPPFLEDTGKLEVSEWDITPHIKPGLNSLEISTTDRNNTFYYLKRIEIFN